MSRYTITVKSLNFKTNRYKVDQKFELNDYRMAMETMEKLEEKFYRQNFDKYFVEFKDNDPFCRNTA